MEPPDIGHGLSSLGLGEEFDAEADRMAAANARTARKKNGGARKVSTGSHLGDDSYGIGEASEGGTNAEAAEAKVCEMVKDGLMELLGISPKSRGRTRRSTYESDDDSVDGATVNKVVLSNGLTLKEGAPRTADEIVKTKVQLSRFKRGEEGSTTADKLRIRWCGTLKGTFKVPNWAGLTAVGSSSDVAEGVIGVQLLVSEFREWCEKADVTGIFKILKGAIDTSSTSTLMLLGLNESMDILHQYKKVSFSDCKRQQAFVLNRCDNVEVVSSDWVLEKLKNSTESSP